MTVAIDKQKHYAVGAALAPWLTVAGLLGGIPAPVALLCAMIATAAIGIGKEARDYVTEAGVPDAQDAAYTAYGAVVPAVIIAIGWGINALVGI